MKIYKVRIDDDENLGMDAISLVEFPAVEVDFISFSKEQERGLNLHSSMMKRGKSPV